MLLAVSLNHIVLLKSMGPDPKHLGFNVPDYRTLYSLLDWMESEGWTEKQIAAVTDQDADAVKAFTGTANNATILDPLARHGEKRWRAPKSIMSLREAQALILPAAKGFLRSREIGRASGRERGCQ